MNRKNRHLNYYIVEVMLLGAGFFVLYLFPNTFPVQFGGLTLLVLFYTIMGLTHHGLEHDIHAKIVLEYIVISALVLALFLFLKSPSV